MPPHLPHVDTTQTTPIAAHTGSLPVGFTEATVLSRSHNRNVWIFCDGGSTTETRHYTQTYVIWFLKVTGSKILAHFLKHRKIGVSSVVTDWCLHSRYVAFVDIILNVLHFICMILRSFMRYHGTDHVNHYGLGRFNLNIHASPCFFAATHDIPDISFVIWLTLDSHALEHSITWYSSLFFSILFCSLSYSLSCSSNTYILARVVISRSSIKLHCIQHHRY